MGRDGGRARCIAGNVVLLNGLAEPINLSGSLEITFLKIETCTQSYLHG